ncbi:MAG: sugar phosphate isomerase/epimerase family protein [Lentisphaeria bacterium]
MEIGVVNILKKDKLDSIFDRVASFGVKTCQLHSWEPDLFTDEIAEKVCAQSKKTGVRVCALWAGYTGRVYWNFTEGPITLGFLPPEHRYHRIMELKKAADFAKKIGTKAIITHCGFLPENMTDSNYKPVLLAIKEVAEYCKKLDVGFWFETGQETPVVLLRVIQDLGLDNLGINLDPANLLLYGKGNPIDSLEVFGKYVHNIHVKDGMPPTNGRDLGKEVQVNTGRVQFPLFIKRLREIGFDEELIIEREIPEGDEQKRDIQETINNLQAWWDAK